MSRQQGRKGKKNAIASLSKAVENVQQNSVFGSYSEAELLSQLKGLALDPCKPQFAQDNILPLWNQILKLRKVMVEDSEIPWRKRKLEQFVKDKLRSPPGFVEPNQQSTRKLRRRQSYHASSLSCLLNSVDDSTQCSHDGKKIIPDYRTSSSLLTFDDSLPNKRVRTEFSLLDDMVGITPTVDTDESVNGSNPLTPENPAPNEAPSLDISSNNAVQYLNLPKLGGGPYRRRFQPPRGSSGSPTVTSDHLQVKFIPVGPRFQADVPKWSGAFNRSVYNRDSDNSKWLGSRVWPIQIGNMKSAGRKLGKGRADTCCCVSPGSADCVRRHVCEKRLLLQCDLGPAFFSWKFDEMGEQVLNSWTPKEEQTFKSVVQMKPNGKTFVKRALKCFPRKDGKCIINYYFNVYIPNRMSMQTRSLSLKQVDTDDEEDDDDEDKDEGEDSSNMGLQKSVSNSKNVKARFLHS